MAGQYTFKLIDSRPVWHYFYRHYKKLLNCYKIPELRKKIGFTFLMIFIYRIGGHIPTPGIDPKVLGEFYMESQNNLLGMFDMFVGGAFKKATIFALGIICFAFFGIREYKFQILRDTPHDGTEKMTLFWINREQFASLTTFVFN